MTRHSVDLAAVLKLDDDLRERNERLVAEGYKAPRRVRLYHGKEGRLTIRIHWRGSKQTKFLSISDTHRYGLRGG